MRVTSFGSSSFAPATGAADDPAPSVFIVSSIASILSGPPAVMTSAPLPDGVPGAFAGSAPAGAAALTAPNSGTIAPSSTALPPPSGAAHDITSTSTTGNDGQHVFFGQSVVSD